MSVEPLEIEDARRLVLGRTTALGAEQVGVREALGRVLAEDVTSAEPVPGFDNSAMDGYAVRAADTTGAGDRPVRLTVVDESRAGHPAARALAGGEAIAISTGAMVPEGADAVVRVEDTDGGGAEVEVGAEVEPGEDIRRAGEDIEAGDTVLRAGAELGPAAVGVLASVGRSEVACAVRPRATVLTTGDELQEPGEALRPGAIRNSNADSVGALVERAGAALLGAEIVADEAEATREAIKGALEGDLVLACGGVSIGEHDHVRPAAAELGVEQVFWRVALRPGAPTYFGVAPSGALVFGLPGNPVSAMVTFLLFARPAIRAMMGAADERRRAQATLAADHPALAKRTQMVRCRLELGNEGWLAHPTGPQGSHVLTSMLDADALALLPPADEPYPAGTRVEIELLP
jgi:molybdopterin molybdotransferase